MNSLTKNKAVTISFIVASIVLAFTLGMNAAVEETQAKPQVVKEKWHKPPKQKKIVKKFVPWAQPSYEQIVKIDRWESQKWGGPSLLNRIRCESTYNWAATNGQYRGLLQYGPIWESMWPGTPRKVTVVTSKTVKKPIVRYRKWSHMNKWVRKERKNVSQKVWTVRKGALPKYADPYHGWAAIRNGARAVSGHGPTTSWSCGL